MNQQGKLGLGMAAIGRPQYINIRQETPDYSSLDDFRKKGITVLDEAYRLGIRYYDTAPGYGMAEQMLIDWVADKNDPAIEVATKWGYTYVADFDPDATQHEVKEHSLSKLNEQWQQSKKLLPNLQIYQIHSATLETGVLENRPVLERLAELKKEYGLQIGLTATGANQTEIIRRALDVEVHGAAIFHVFQVTYNVFDQSLASISDRIIDRGGKIVVKEALANGRVFPNNDYPHYSGAYKALITLAEKYQTGTDAIALRFCLDSIPSFRVLSGAAGIDHLQANMQAETSRLDAEDTEFLRGLKVPVEAYWQERKNLGWN